MLEGIINTRPTSNVVLGRSSTYVTVPISTFVPPYGPCTPVDIRIITRINNRPHITFSVGLVYSHGKKVKFPRHEMIYQIDVCQDIIKLAKIIWVKM